MRPRKLQIFLSSTYEDLVEHRLAAMEAILASGHIPAAMEQFSPGDETAWEKITRWIDESDAFILILGGRYGSIEPASKKSFVQLEYEYALKQRKPHFALVVSPKHHEERVKEKGLSVDEREYPDRFRAFKEAVTQKLCRFWNDKKDIQAAIFQKLPEWAQREDLKGWIPAEDAASPQLASELATLSQENRELRAKAGSGQDFDGLSFDEMVDILKDTLVGEGSPRYYLSLESSRVRAHHLGHLFEAIHPTLAAGFDSLGKFAAPEAWALLRQLIAMNLLEKQGTGAMTRYSLTGTGRRFRNRLLASGTLDERLGTLWGGSGQSEADPGGGEDSPSAPESGKAG